MKVTIQNRETLRLREVPPGTVFRRVADGMFFLKSSNYGKEDSSGNYTNQCVELTGWAIFDIRPETIVEPAPNAELTVSW